MQKTSIDKKRRWMVIYLQFALKVNFERAWNGYAFMWLELQSIYYRRATIINKYRFLTPSDFTMGNATPTNVTFVMSYNNNVTSLLSTSATATTTTSNGEFKLIRGEHKVKVRGSIDEEEPPRRLGLFEIYGILLVSQTSLFLVQTSRQKG